MTSEVSGTSPWNGLWERWIPMHKVVFRSLAVGMAGSLLQGLAAQSGGAVIYPEKLHADVEVLRAYINQAHPDPYRYRTQAELDRMVTAVSDSITLPLTAAGFQQRLTPLFRAVGDAHFHPLPPAEDARHLASTVPVLPLRVRILDSALYVEEELKGFRSLPPGSRILAVNGHSAEDILARLEAGIICDGSNTTYRARLIERDFPMLYHAHVEQPGTFVVRYRDPEGREDKRTIFAMTGSEIGSSMKPTGAQQLPWGAVWVPESSALWVTMHTLDPDSLLASGKRAETFLASMLKELKQNKAHALVLDLRGAGGRELGMAELVFASVAKEPFRLVQGMSVRSLTPPEHYEFAVPQPDHYAMAPLQFLPTSPGANVLRPDDHRLEELPPTPRGFQGKVYVVCDGMTRDAGAAFVMLAKRTGRARVIGEEVGTNAFSFTGGRELLVTLPNSGVRFTVPLVRYIPDGSASGPMDHGELPNYTVEQRPDGLAKGRDTIREALLEMIRELQ